MKRRCQGGSKHHTPLCESYKNRGIKICEEWNYFQNFYNDMYPAYSENMTLDRINPNEGYSKLNCQWVTMDQQAKNKLKYKSNSLGISNVFFSYKGDVVFLTSKITYNKKSFKKRVSLNRLDFNEALKIITNWRDNKRKELGFSEFHGGD